MDPELQKKIAAFRARARAAGKSDAEIDAFIASQMGVSFGGVQSGGSSAAPASPKATPDLDAFRARARAAGKSDAEIEAFIAAKMGAAEQPQQRDLWGDDARALGMGATAGFLDEIAGLPYLIPGGKTYTERRDEVRTNYEEAKAANPKRMLAMEAAGGLGGAVLGGGALRAAGYVPRLFSGSRAIGAGARALEGAKAGAAAGSLAGVGYSENEDVAGVARDAAIGGATGGLLGAAAPVAGKAVGSAFGKLRNVLAPAKEVVEEVAFQLPDDASAIMARQERLAPGTAVLADLTPETMKLARGVGFDRQASKEAREFATRRVDEIHKGLRRIGDQIDQYNKMKLQVTPEADAVLRKNGILAANGETTFKTAQRLRSALKEKFRKTTSGTKKQDLKPQIDALDSWIHNHIAEIKQLDSDYAFMLDRLDAAKTLDGMLAETSASHAANRVYSIESGSAGGSLPGPTSGSGGMWEDVKGLLQPNKADRAVAARTSLLTPELPAGPSRFDRTVGGVGGLLDVLNDPKAWGLLGGRYTQGLLD